MSDGVKAWALFVLRFGPAWMVAAFLMELGGTTGVWAEVFIFGLMLIWVPMIVGPFWQPGSRVHHHAIEQAYIDAFVPLTILSSAGAILMMAQQGFDSMAAGILSGASILLIVAIARDRTLLLPVLRRNRPRHRTEH